MCLQKSFHTSTSRTVTAVGYQITSKHMKVVIAMVVLPVDRVEWRSGWL